MTIDCYSGSLKILKSVPSGMQQGECVRLQFHACGPV